MPGLQVCEMPLSSISTARENLAGDPSPKQRIRRVKMRLYSLMHREGEVGFALHIEDAGEERVGAGRNECVVGAVPGLIVRALH